MSHVLTLRLFSSPLHNCTFSGIDLENIVYYKDDTHYFVMTAKKQSLLEKGVILHVSDQEDLPGAQSVCSILSSFLYSCYIIIIMSSNF